jgi:hypothetical protein
MGYHMRFCLRAPVNKCIKDKNTTQSEFFLNSFVTLEKYRQNEKNFKNTPFEAPY